MSTFAARLSPAIFTCFGLVAAVTFATAGARAEPPPDESKLGVLPVTGRQVEHVPAVAVMPSLASLQADVVTRSVVRRDLELTSLFRLVDEAKAPSGLYGFDDPVDVAGWKAAGAEMVVKVAAKAQDQGGKIELHAFVYFMNVGQKPVFTKMLLCSEADVRVTAHRLTDLVLGALTGTNGSFASHFTYASPWAGRPVVLAMDADGHSPRRVTDPAVSSTAPFWGPQGTLFFSQSKNYAPYLLSFLAPGKTDVQRVALPFRGSIYASAFDDKFKHLALAVGEEHGTAIYRAEVTGQSPLVLGAFKKVSTTPISAEPVWSSEGKLAWIGGDPKTWGGQRVYVEGKAVSPAGFSASSPTFCDTEDGVRLVYSVEVGGRRDLVLSNAAGQGMTRLTQSMGSNTSPACSPDGRLLAFFSTRKQHEGKSVTQGLYLMSLKRWRTVRVSGQYGSRLRWSALPAATP